MLLSGKAVTHGAGIEIVCVFVHMCAYVHTPVVAGRHEEREKSRACVCHMGDVTNREKNWFSWTVKNLRFTVIDGSPELNPMKYACDV